MMNQEDLLAELSRGAEAVTGVLDNILAETNGHENRVVEAMRYASLAGGKRVRPFLVCATAALFDVEESRALRAAAAVELIHCYSLVHDDLPAMDDDELRRGQPTCHIAFDEATAILAGDALLTKAFEVLADAKTHAEPSIRSALVKVLAKASGHEGMVGGQIIDLYAENYELDVPEITRLQRMKTGALIAVSCDIGALMGEASEEARHYLREYAHDIGLAGLDHRQHAVIDAAVGIFGALLVQLGPEAELRLGENVARIGKRRHPAAVDQARVPADMIGMQMGTHHEIDVVALGLICRRAFVVERCRHVRQSRLFKVDRQPVL